MGPISRKDTPKMNLPKMTTTALKGKQSVRTNFKLSAACIHAINIVATQLGIKHRSLFDYLVEDADSLKAIAAEIAKKNPRANRGIQKSFIVSRETLGTIDEMCEELKISRDTLVELSVRRLLPIVEKEIESHRKRKILFESVRNHYAHSRKVLSQIKEDVGADDPIYKVYQNTVSTCKQVMTQVGDIISKGKVLEGFDPESFK